jgi:hypothetical protein
MSTTVSHGSRPIVPVPLSLDPDDSRFGAFMQAGHTSYSVKRVHGRCSRFCDYDDVPTSGATIAEHGPMCRSHGPLFSRVVGFDGRQAGLGASLAAPYLHGIYDAFEVYSPEMRAWIELAVEFPTADGGWAEGELYLNAEDARTIAAGLMQLAHELETRDEPLREARARREAEARTEVQA